MQLLIALVFLGSACRLSSFFMWREGFCWREISLDTPFNSPFEMRQNDDIDVLLIRGWLWYKKSSADSSNVLPSLSSFSCIHPFQFFEFRWIASILLLLDYSNSAFAFNLFASRLLEFRICFSISSHLGYSNPASAFKLFVSRLLEFQVSS